MSKSLSVQIPAEFSSTRLHLRRPAPADAAALHQAVHESFDTHRKFLNWQETPPSLDETTQNIIKAGVDFDAKTSLRYHLFLKSTGQFVGRAGFYKTDWAKAEFEIGYWCRSGLQGQALIPEAVTACVDLAIKEFGAKKLEIRCDRENLSGQRVAYKSGFKLDPRSENSPELVFTYTPNSQKRIAILQSSYIPWKGYFDIINSVDTFVLLENVQYTKNDWRNRNKIKTPQGPLWLTIPVLTHDKQHQLISEAKIKNELGWQKKHWRSIQQNYARAPHFAEYAKPLESIYLGAEWTYLSELNIRLITDIAALLGINTKFVHSKDLNLSVDLDTDGRRTDRVIAICEELGGTSYLSGPSARDYIEPEKFSDKGIELRFQEYNYPEYPQLYPPFEHSVSILDLIFNCGQDAPRYIWGDAGLPLAANGSR